jgi:hypothetical protein
VSDEGSAGWLGTTARADVVATKVVSGLYDTASGSRSSTSGGGWRTGAASSTARSAWSRS